MKKLFELDKNQLLALGGFFWLGLIFWAIILTLGGVFYKTAIFIYLILGGGSLFYILFLNRKKITLETPTLIVSLAAILLIIFLFISSSPSVFSGRDQGSFSEAAIRLSQNHQLKFSFPAQQEFFKIYGPGKALNFPGFNYTQDGQLITQFPVGYISWLAVFYSFFGLDGLMIANGITFFIFLLSFYLLARLYLKPAPALIAFLFAASSFVFSWFFKLTLSENLAMALIWFGLFQIMEYFKNYKKINLIVSLFAFYLLAFTRIEALAILVMVFIVLYALTRKTTHFKRIFSAKSLLVAASFILVYFTSLFINKEFYVSFIKGMLGSVSGYKNAGSLSQTIPALAVLHIWTIYGLTVFLALGIVGVFYFYNKKKTGFLIPFFVLWPTFIYLVHPSVTLDHPWMLRRYIFSVLPLLMFYSACFLYFFFSKQKRVFYFISTLLIIASFSMSLIYFNMPENNRLLPQIENLSQNFQNSDLVLIDQKATGDGWSMMSGPMNFLYQKQAVYFFNPNDLEKVDQKRFDHVYLIIPDGSQALWEPIIKKFSLKKEYQLENTILGNPGGMSSDLPIITSQTIHGGIYLLEN